MTQTRGKCAKENCKYKHVLQPCRDYDKGFCINGKGCNYAHIPKKLCLNYVYGFCPQGTSLIQDPTVPTPTPRSSTISMKSFSETSTNSCTFRLLTPRNSKSSGAKTPLAKKLATKLLSAS